MEPYVFSICKMQQQGVVPQFELLFHSLFLHYVQWVRWLEEVAPSKGPSLAESNGKDSGHSPDLALILRPIQTEALPSRAIRSLASGLASAALGNYSLWNTLPQRQH